jgi:hypothetical protein
MRLSYTAITASRNVLQPSRELGVLYGDSQYPVNPSVIESSDGVENCVQSLSKVSKFASVGKYDSPAASLIFFQILLDASNLDPHEGKV